MKPVLGWRERISFPDWSVDHMIAKLDSGAKTSSLDATEIEWLDDDRVRFRLITSRKLNKSCVIECDVHRIDTVKSSNGSKQTRIFVRTEMVINGTPQQTEFSLSNRSGMRIRCLLGRKALTNYYIDSEEKYLAKETTDDR